MTTTHRDSQESGPPHGGPHCRQRRWPRNLIVAWPLPRTVTEKLQPGPIGSRAPRGRPSRPSSTTGRLLAEAKEALPHGSFLKLFKDHNGAVAQPIPFSAAMGRYS